MKVLTRWVGSFFGLRAPPDVGGDPNMRFRITGILTLLLLLLGAGWIGRLTVVRAPIASFSRAIGGIDVESSPCAEIVGTGLVNWVLKTDAFRPDAPRLHVAIKESADRIVGTLEDSGGRYFSTVNLSLSPDDRKCQAVGVVMAAQMVHDLEVEELTYRRAFSGWKGWRPNSDQDARTPTGNPRAKN